MNAPANFLPVLGALAVLTVSAIAQHQTYDKTTPPANAPANTPPAVESQADAIPPTTYPNATAPSPTAPVDPSNSSAMPPASTPRAEVVDRLTSDSSRFKALDTDGDNRISRAEFTLAPNLQLQTGDSTTKAPADGTDKSGAGKYPTNPESEQRSAVVTSENDLKGTSTTNSVELFNDLDTDKDGFLSPAELASDLDRAATK